MDNLWLSLSGSSVLVRYRTGKKVAEVRGQARIELRPVIVVAEQRETRPGPEEDFLSLGVGLPYWYELAVVPMQDVVGIIAESGEYPD